MPLTLADAQSLDRTDPLARHRDAFALPQGVIYLDGNSLGPLPHVARQRIADVTAQQWGTDLIRSWNVHGWIDLPASAGRKIEPIIGAEPNTVVVADSTSVNLFKLLAVALKARPGRRAIVSQKGNFPTDLYIAQGLVGLLGHAHELRTVDHDGIEAAITDDVAVVLLTEVDYRSGRRLDMKHLTARAHAAGALVIWDLCHSAGAFPVDLSGADADFAVGCGYKYLNGGPGAPSFVYVAPRHLPGLSQPLSGWLGHATPFAFGDDYQPAPSIEAMRSGTPPILSLASLDAALDVFAGVDMKVVRAKADRLFDIFAARIEADCPQLEIASPRDAAQRGTQIALRFADGYAAMQALIARGVIGDFRGPNIMRFGFAPLYLSHADVWHAADALVDVMRTAAWDRPEYKVKAKVV